MGRGTSGARGRHDRSPLPSPRSPLPSYIVQATNPETHVRNSTRGIVLAAAIVGTAGTLTFRAAAPQAQDQQPTVTVYKSPT